MNSFIFSKRALNTEHRVVSASFDGLITYLGAVSSIYNVFTHADQTVCLILAEGNFILAIALPPASFIQV